MHVIFQCFRKCIGDTIVCADYSEGNDTLVFKSDGSLDNELIDSYSNYITKRNEGVQWAVKGKTVLLDEGTIESSFPDATERAPRTFIAQDYDGYYYIGVTGYQTNTTGRTGPTYQELADFVYSLATNMKFAYALDGGGSSALLDGTDRLNTDIQHVDRAVSNCICFYATGWLKKGDYWYYYNSNHQTETGWKLINSKWYYLSPANGAMVTGWQLINNKWYYFNDSGAMQTGWQLINNKWYYFSDSGAMQTGFKLIDNIWYYFNDEGVYSSAYNSIVYGNVSGTYAWWYVVNGKVSFNSTPTVAENENGWWYVHYGYVDFEFTGIAHNSYGYWYCENGEVQFGYSGWIYYNGDAWYVREGSATQMG